MKRAAEMRNGQKSIQVTEIAAYLFNKSPSHSGFQLKGQDRYQQWHHLQLIFEHIARRLTLKAFDNLQGFRKQGDSHEIAWNKCTVDLTKVSLKRLHTQNVIELGRQSAHPYFPHPHFYGYGA
jgi:hypothetical protein